MEVKGRNFSIYGKNRVFAVYFFYCIQEKGTGSEVKAEVR
jgi:hypothetical protein